MLQLFGTILGVIVMLTGMVRFIEILFDYNTGIDKWLYPSKLFRYGSNGKPNYMAPNTALGIGLLGVALYWYYNRTKYKRYVSDFAALIVLILAFLSIVGYLYRSVQLYDVGSFIPMAFPTALSFLLMPLSLLLHRSNHGILKLLTRRYEGSKMARFLLPFAILVPVVTGMLRLYGEQLGLYSLQFGVTLFAVSNVLVFVALIWWCSIYLNKSSVALRKEMMRRIKLQEQLWHLNKELEEKVAERTNQLMVAEEQKRALEKKLMTDKIEHQKKMIQATVAGQEKEKKNMGMELHDNINQILASAKLCLDIGRSNPELKDEMICKSASQILLAVNEIRALSKSLMPYGIGGNSIVESVNEAIETIRCSSDINFTNGLSKELLNHLNMEQQTAVYRIIQEQLNNIVKHAAAGHVEILMHRTDDRIQLVIKDDGKGFNPESKRAGIGLSNIKSRAEFLDGKIEITSSIGKGSCLKIDFPIHQVLYV